MPIPGEITHWPRRRGALTPPRDGKVSPATWLLALSLFVILGWGACGCAPAPRPPLPNLASLDALEERAERIEARRDLAAFCSWGCIAGVRSVKVTRHGVECRCVALASLGVHRIEGRRAP